MHEITEEQLGLAFQVGPTAMLVVSGDGRIRLANPQAEAMFGYGRGELRNVPLESLLPLAARARHPEHMAAYFANPLPRAMGAGRDLTGLRRDGVEIPIEIGLTPMATAEGTFVLASVIDIGHRKVLEADLRLSEARQRQIVEGTPHAMIVVDANSHIVSVNSHAETLFGWSRDDLVGRCVDVLVPHRFRADHPRAREAYRENPTQRPMGAGRDLFGLRADGSEVPIEIGLNPLVTSEGTFVLAAIIDITERKRAEDALRASLSEKEMLLREIHHRVKNNMQVVSSILSLQSAKIPTPEHRDMLLECQRRVRAMALIHEKLYGTGGGTVDLGAYVRDLVRMAMSTYEGGAADVELAVDTDSVLVDAQTAIPVGLVLHELVTNAMKHAFAPRRRGRLDVVLRCDDRQCDLEVRDDGPGIPDVVQRRADGLGLKIVDRLSAQIDGVVAIDTARGTAFHVRFPLHRPRDPTSRP